MCSLSADEKTGFTEQKFVILSAPSGSGKTTLAKHLLNTFPALSFCISATTRLPRPGEKHGRDYYFLSRDTFLEKTKMDFFLEWEEVYTGLCYGTPKEEIVRLKREGKHVLFDVDVQGGQRLKKIFPHAKAFFLVPKSIDILAQRLMKRRSEDDARIQQRLKKARAELQAQVYFDRVILNDVLSKAKRKIEEEVRYFLYP